MFDLEPDYNAKQKGILAKTNKMLNIPEKFEFIEFYEMSGGLVKEGFELFKQLERKSFKDQKNEQITNWQTYVIGAIRKKEEQNRELANRDTLQAYKDAGVKDLDSAINKCNNNYYNKTPVPKTYYSNR